MLPGSRRRPSSYNRSPTQRAAERRPLRVAAHAGAAFHRRGIRAAARCANRSTAPSTRRRSDVEAPFVAEIVRQEWVPVRRRRDQRRLSRDHTLDGRLQTARIAPCGWDSSTTTAHAIAAPDRRLKLEEGTAPGAARGAACRRAAHWQPAGRRSCVGGSCGARVYLRGGGLAQIDWEGMAWARGDAASGRADTLLHRGDLVT